MEDTLREINILTITVMQTTGLNPCFNGRYSQSANYIGCSSSIVVLILVLMEDTLREFSVTGYICKDAGLNPCFNGRYSQRYYYDSYSCCSYCLNPCFNGRYSQSTGKINSQVLMSVLILVLMEDTLRVFPTGSKVSKEES